MKSKFVKSFMCFLLVFILVLPSMAVASENDILKSDKINENAYFEKILSIEFSNPVISFRSGAIDAEQFASVNVRNIDCAIESVKGLNLVSKGWLNIEEETIKTLQQFKEDGAILHGFEMLLPKAINTRGFTDYVSFGSYNGISMYQSHNVYNVQYTRLSTDSNKIEKWTKGILDVIMVFANWKIALPYSIFGTLPNDPAIVTRGPQVVVNSAEEVTERLISCKDVNGKYGPKNQYAGVFKDMAKTCSENIVFFPNSPYLSPQISATKPRQPIYTADYTNASVIKNLAYNQYIGLSYDMLIRTLPAPTLSFQ